MALDTFRINFFCPRWGATDAWMDFCKRVKTAGYDGVECFLPFDEEEKQEALAAFKHYELKFIGQYFQSFESNVAEHAESYLLDDQAEAVDLALQHTDHIHSRVIHKIFAKIGACPEILRGH
jgi:sugar phosphate isomerase/epimerase